MHIMTMLETYVQKYHLCLFPMDFFGREISCSKLFMPCTTIETLVVYALYTATLIRAAELSPA